MLTNPNAFDEFRSKRDVWIACMTGDDLHSIMNQIRDMIWESAAYRMVNEGRRIAPSASEGGVRLNGMMHSMIDGCFFTSQMSAIRRLQDTFKIAGTKGVYSLTGLLADMKSSVNLLTREHFFEVEGLAYDSTAIETAGLEYSMSQLRAGNKAYAVPPHLNSHIHERRHVEVDCLSGVNKEARSKNDSVQSVIFEQLEAKLGMACNEITNYVNKFVAHAATPESRKHVNADDVAVTLGHLWKCHRAICEVANFVDIFLLTGTSHGFVASPQYDQFQYIDQPLVSTDGVQHLRKAWRQFEQETETWGKYGIDELVKELAVKDDVPRTANNH